MPLPCVAGPPQAGAEAAMQGIFSWIIAPSGATQSASTHDRALSTPIANSHSTGGTRNHQQLQAALLSVLRYANIDETTAQSTLALYSCVG